LPITITLHYTFQLKQKTLLTDLQYSKPMPWKIKYNIPKTSQAPLHAT